MTASGRRVYLAQPNHQYGKNVFLPYSVGLLQAYARSVPEIDRAYEFPEMVFLRDPVDDVVSRWANPDVVGLSCYIWNEQYLMALAKAVKALYPNCLVVMGGPQAPAAPPASFFEERPYLDLLVHYEGEHAFADVLRERLKASPDYGSIPGVTFNDHGESRRGPSRERTKTPDEIPSPYLTGLFDPFFACHPDLDFHATSESHRGCPFLCHYCDWGGLVYTKVNKFSNARVKAEYDWTAAHRIELVYNADANFMMLPRDRELTDYLIALKARTGWPKQIRAAWAKVSSDRIFESARALHASGMDKGVTLALQSLHPPTLKAIERANIKFDSFGELVGRYQAESMPVYVEFILALPEETYDTFCDGIGQVLGAGLDDGLNIYLCMILPNSEVGDPAYRERYGMKTVRGPLLQQHCTPAADGPVEEAELVVATGTMPPWDFAHAFTFAWAVQAFHGMGLTRNLARWWVTKGGTYRSFYTALVQAAQTGVQGKLGVDPKGFATPLGKLYQAMRAQFDLGLEGKGWGRVDPRYGEVLWPLEEATFLDAVSGDLDALYRELGEVFHAPQGILDVEKDGLRTPEEFGGDLVAYAQQVVWYGRKGGKFRHDS